MSIKCEKCNNKMFDSRAYLKISEYERTQQEVVERCTEELKVAKEKYGKKSEVVSDLQRNLNIENRVLREIIKCKNALY